MPTPEEEALQARRKRTAWLFAGGAASLLLPLMGVIYVRLSESSANRGPNSAVMFDRREAGERKINPTQTVAIVNPALVGDPKASPDSGSSLNFVKGSGDYFQEKATETAKAPPAPPEPAPAAAEPAPTPPVKAAVAAKKGGKKPFIAPRLQPGKGFSAFKGNSPKPTGGEDVQGALDPQAKGGGDMTEMLKNLPPGAENNPEIQKYLRGQ
ncbi:MAG: hypothetical protein HYZ74_04300 [Elusimicrobia bacterium]|nr:hypothetical protein [Elusimicrobiota bacterium]